MARAILDQGLTDLRDAVAARITHIGVSTDATAFAATQTALNPSGAGTNLIKPSTSSNVSATTVDESITITGASEFTGLTINTIGALDGSTRTDAVARIVRSAGIGVIAGDVFTVGVRFVVSDVT